jgi:hypothetical protein
MRRLGLPPGFHESIDSGRLDPSPEMLQSLVKVYVDRIADQPLPLFDVRTLPDIVQKFSNGLLRSFLALTIRYSKDSFFDDSQSNGAAFYKNSASEMLFAQVAEATGDLELLQAFCLLSLSEIAGQVPTSTLLLLTNSEQTEI